jgi:DNA processing protein
MNKNINYWIAASMVDKVGPVTLRKLLDQHGSIIDVCRATNAPLKQAEELILKARRMGVELLPLEDKGYPDLLRHIYDPPPVLYVKGKNLSLDKAVAIVGTRRASRYGKETARKLAYELSSLGFTIVSGLAAGIDTCAHRGALDARGETIAVFGCGVDIIFPAENKSLAREIEASGSLVSEFPLGTGTEKGHFPRRNRIISGLSMGVIVVEGHYDSGAMITAKAALEQGREVFAVPGNVELDQSKGPHWLIKQGAKLVESVEDVLEEFNMVMPKRMTNEAKDYSNLPAEEQKIISVLSLEPMYIDNISIETGLSIPQVSSLLMMLEVKKLVRQLPGKMFVLY